MADLKKLLTIIDESIEGFNGTLTSKQRELFDDLQNEIAQLKVKNGRIAPAVENLRMMNRIRTRVLELMSSDDYVQAVREFVEVFDTINQVQTAYFTTIEKNYKPSAFAEEMRKQMITETVRSLTEQGIGGAVADGVHEIIRQNITSGSEYKDLANQLREHMVQTDTDGALIKHAKQITTDAVNQYAAQNNQIISADLGFEWYSYQGKDIDTTRPFCDAMTDKEFFHASEIPDILAGVGLKYDGGSKAVPIYSKTGLPHGMIPGTNESNFMVRRGGYNCGHQIFPVFDFMVPAARVAEVKESAAYKTWKSRRK